MKGQECSWADLRRIRRILLVEDGLPGAFASLKRCVGKAALSSARRAIELMDAVSISKLKNVYPSHAVEIVRRKPREEWARWIKLCEQKQWTVRQLRNQLLGIDEDALPQGRTVATYHQELERALVAIRRAQEHPDKLVSTAVVTCKLHAELVSAIGCLEEMMAKGQAA